VSDNFTAQLVEIADEGVRLAPTLDTVVPDDPSEVNLLALAVLHALGLAGWQHHPTPRDPKVQTLRGALAGEVSLPWQPGASSAGYVVCERQPSSVWICRLANSV
jgi:hypothetical protein